jgi:ABC-type sugar transport system permease subunit
MSEIAQTVSTYRGALRRKRDVNRAVFVALLLLPAVAALLLFMYYPIEETFRLSFMKATGLGDAVYTGLGNYVKLLHDEQFLAALLHVFAWAFFSVVVQLPLAFAIAFSLIAYRNRVTRSLRAVYYLASILPSAITAMIGRFVFSPKNGIISTVAAALKIRFLQKIDFLGDPNIAFWTIFMVATWTYTGFYIVYLMARIEQIPMEIREAAELDGASGWRYAWHIVIPIVTYPLRIIAVLCVVGSMKVFDLPYMITAGGPGNATVTLGIMVYNDGFVNWQYGKAAAVGVVILLCSLLFTVAQFSFQSREGKGAS